MKLIFTLILFLLFNFLQAQSPLIKQWDKRFGGTNYESLYALIQNSDGSYILGGYSNSDINGDKSQLSWASPDYWIIKIDSSGIKQWDKRYGGFGVDHLQSLQQTTDNGYILAGYSLSGISGDKSQSNWDPSLSTTDYWVVKIDSVGNKLWDKRFGGNYWDYLLSVQQTNDNGYILGGYSLSDSSGDKTQHGWGGWDYWIVKIDSSGNKQWDKRYGGTSNEVFQSIIKSNNNSYILCGLSSSRITGDKSQDNWDTISYTTDYWIVKIDSLGNKLWDKRFGGLSHDDAHSILSTSDGNYIIGGESFSNIGGNKTQTSYGIPDYWIVKIDSLGNLLWEKEYGGSDFEGDITNIIQTADYGILIGGMSRSPISGIKTESNLGPQQMWLVKTDSIGNIKWDKTIITNGFDQSCLLVPTIDGCYSIATFTDAGIAGYKSQSNWDPSNVTTDYWIVKFCDTTLTGINNLSELHDRINVYPNPFDETLNITLNENVKSEIIMYDATSRIVLQKNFTKEIKLNTINLSKGLYIYEVRNNIRSYKYGKVLKH